MTSQYAYWSPKGIRMVDDEWDLIQRNNSRNNTCRLKIRPNINRIKDKVAYFNQTLDTPSKKPNVPVFVVKLEIKLLTKKDNFLESGLKTIEVMHRDVECAS